MVVTNNISRIDPTRNTVGSIYNEISKNSVDQYVTAGDMSHELMKSFTEDLNDTIASNPFGEDEFYITVYEKKDLQMKRSILRRLYVSKYRPYPEDDTVVFHVDPKSHKVKFCWCLPHSTQMDNILMTAICYSKDFIDDIIAWKCPNYRACLKHFGFEGVGKFIVPSKENRDRPLNFKEISVKI